MSSLPLPLLAKDTVVVSFPDAVVCSSGVFVTRPSPLRISMLYAAADRASDAAWRNPAD